MIIPTAEPFYFAGDRIGCLLIHGFTGSPKEMRWMGEYLAARGHTCLGVRLAGHATQPEDLVRTRWRDWVASVEDGYHQLKSSSDQIFVMGLSMGGILALLFAANHAVAGVIAMSTPYSIGSDPRLAYAQWLCWLLPEVSKGAADWHDPVAGNEHVEYPKYPTRAIAELRDLGIEMRAALPKVKAPVLLMHSRQDRGVLPINAEQIFNRLPGADKSIVWVENSGHVITREPERQLVFESAEAFIQSHINPKA
jgi:carboxylesterase